MTQPLISADREGLKQRVKWLIGFRIVIALVLIIGTVVLRPDPENDLLHTSFDAVIAILAFHFVMALVFALGYRFTLVKGIVGFALIQIAWDLLFNTALVYITGGIGSEFKFMYWLTIINAAVLLFRPGAYTAALVSGLLYGALVNLEYLGWIPVLFEVPGRFAVWHENKVIASIFLNVVAFLLVAWGSSHVSARLRQTEVMLVEKSIDLEDLEALMRRIVESLTNGLVTLDSRGRITYWNQAAEQISGRSGEEVRGRLFAEVFPEAESFMEETSPETTKRLGPWTWEMKHRTRDGNERILGCSSADLQGTVEGDQGKLVILQDLTDYRRMQEQVKRADRLAAVGELAARMAHEIRNPLTSVSGSIEMLKKNLDLTETEQKLMNIVVRETDRLNQLLTDFLMFAKPAPPSFEEVSLDELVRDSTELFTKSHAERRVRLEVDLAEGVLVEGDSKLLAQMVWNLMKNASEAMPEGGAIRVVLRHDPDSSVVVVEVHDQGPGIPKDLAEKIFQPFFTTKTRGTGLGLAMVRRIAEDHQGEVSVAPSAFGGSVFSIQLPGTLRSVGSETSQAMGRA